MEVMVVLLLSLSRRLRLSESHLNNTNDTGMTRGGVVHSPNHNGA